MSIFAAFPDFAALHAQGFPDVQCGKATLMIAMTARTGSTHLCAALAETEGILPPVEIFNPRGVLHAEMARRGVATFADYMKSFSTQPGPVFIFKTSWMDFDPLAESYRQLFPSLKIIFLDRRDVIAQAVSLFRATISGHWHQPRTAQAAAPAISPVCFDLPRIIAILQNLEAEKQAWRDFFNRESRAPRRIFYEDFAGDITFALDAIADELGMALNRNLRAETGFEKLADAQSEDWIGRVRRHLWRLT